MKNSLGHSIRSYLRALFLNGAGSIVTQGATLVLTFLVANTFGPSGLTKFSITQSTVNMAATIGQFGLGYTAFILISHSKIKNYSESISVIQFCLSTVFIFSLICSALLFAFSGLISSYLLNDPSLVFFVSLSAIGVPFMALSLVQQSVLNGLERHDFIFYLSLISMATSISLVLLGGSAAGLQGAAVGFVISLAVRAAMLQMIIQKLVPLKWALPKAATWGRIRSFAIPAGLAGLSLMPSTWFANAWLIKHQGLETQGLVLAALTVRAAISLVPQQLSTVLLPRYLRSVEESAGHHRILMLAYAAVFGLTTGLFCIAAFIFRDDIFQLFGEEFYADSTILILLLSANFVEALGMPFSLYYARRKQMWSYLLTFTYPKDLVLVIASLVFIPVYGGVGIAYAYLGSAVFGFISLAVAQIITYLRRRIAVN